MEELSFRDEVPCRTHTSLRVHVYMCTRHTCLYTRMHLRMHTETRVYAHVSTGPGARTARAPGRGGEEPSRCAQCASSDPGTRAEGAQQARPRASQPRSRIKKLQKKKTVLKKRATDRAEIRAMPVPGKGLVSRICEQLPQLSNERKRVSEQESNRLFTKEGVPVAS